jgi:hypothetical protein
MSAPLPPKPTTLVELVAEHPSVRRRLLAAFVAREIGGQEEDGTGHTLHPRLGRVWVSFWADAADTPDRARIKIPIFDENSPDAPLEKRIPEPVQRAHTLLLLTASGGRLLGRAVPAAAAVAWATECARSWNELEPLADGPDLSWPLSRVVPDPNPG